MRDKRCQVCGVHANICVCDACTPITGAPLITVLQHPSEVRQHKGTLRIARACLPSLRTVVGETPADFACLRAELVPSETALLFPTTTSQALEETAQPVRIHHWLILDGTWRKARKLLHCNTWLAELPAYHFAAPPVSAYRIRKSPRGDGLATAEAIRQLLALVAPGTRYDHLDSAMRALVNAELAQVPVHLRRHYQ